MLTSEDYRQLAERCAVLARECAAPDIAEGVWTLALDYLARAVCWNNPTYERHHVAFSLNQSSSAFRLPRITWVLALDARWWP